MLSGYFPALSQSIVVFLSDGHGTVIVPESELFFAKDGWFRDIRTFVPTTTDYILSPIEVATPILVEVCHEKGISKGVIGIEKGPSSIPTIYPEIFSTEGADQVKWTEVLPTANFQDATTLLQEASMIKSPLEIEYIILANKAAHFGFEAARAMIQPGAREVEVAEAAKTAIEIKGTGMANVRRAYAWVSCMSGERTANAHMSYQYSTNKRLLPGEPVVVHIVCCVDGFWTEVIRTFFVGHAHEDMITAYSAILDVWKYILDAIHPGVKVAELDSVARSALEKHGYTELFTHGLGHGVGFKAVDEKDRPVIHPRSNDILENDMVFTIEPAVYMQDKWGIRITDVVSVRGSKFKVLSEIPRDVKWSICSGNEQSM
jgi:Xaa-Pro aminopeptidase